MSNCANGLLLLVVAASLGCAATPVRVERPTAVVVAEPPAPSDPGPGPVAASPHAKPDAEAPDAEAPGAQGAPRPRRPFEAARAGLSVRKPSGWGIQRRDMALVYAAPMRVPSVVLFTPDGTTLDGVVTGLAGELEAPLGRVRITRAPTETTMAGYRAFVVEGSGTAEGFPMRWRATVVEAKELTVVLALAPSFFWGANVGAIRAFERGVGRAAALRVPATEVAQR